MEKADQGAEFHLARLIEDNWSGTTGNRKLKQTEEKKTRSYCELGKYKSN